MQFKLRRALLPILALVATSGCASTQVGTQLEAELAVVPVFRGVDAKANGRATLSPAQFRFNNALSVFTQAAQAPVLKPCNYQFDITIANAPPQLGVQGTVAGLPGYVATFDNVPPGHWSITPPIGTSTATAAAAASAYAQGHRGFVVAGTQNNCN